MKRSTGGPRGSGSGGGGPRGSSGGGKRGPRYGGSPAHRSTGGRGFAPARPQRAPAEPAAPPKADVRTLIAAAWQSYTDTGEPPRETVRALFAAHPELPPEHRGRFVQNFYALIQQQRRLAFALLPARPALSGPQAPPSGLAMYCALRVLNGTMSPATATKICRGIDWPAVYDLEPRLAQIADPAEQFAVRYSLPDALAALILERFGNQSATLAKQLNAPPPLTLRANALKANRTELLERFREAGVPAEPTRYARDGVTLTEWRDCFDMPEYQKGLFEVQDEASQLVAELTAPPPHGLVIDYCAGAGGKTLALGALMRSQGRIVALDIHAKRLAELQRRARRAGLSNTRIEVLPQPGAPGAEPAPLSPLLKSLEGKADRVLIDAPCSGLGALRRKPELRWRFSLEELARLPQQQFDLAVSAARFVKPGGRLIYATCTFLREENEEVVARIEKATGFTRIPVKEILGSALAQSITNPEGTALELLPHHHGTDGFYAAVLRRAK